MKGLNQPIPPRKKQKLLVTSVKHHVTHNQLSWNFTRDGQALSPEDAQEKTVSTVGPTHTHTHSAVILDD